MDYKLISTGMLGENCYLIYNTDKCVIADPGDEKDKIINAIDEMSLTPLAVILTHGHFDHVGASSALSDKYDIPVYISEKDYNYMTSERESVFYIKEPVNKEKVKFIKENDVLKIGDMEFKIMETPGHSKGSVCYFSENLMISGDLIFRDSIGRTDLEGGSFEEMRETFTDKIFPIENNFTVLTGHGDTTTLEFEKKYNQYMQYYGSKL